MDHKYRKNYGILVGIFDEDELKSGKDDDEIAKLQEKFPKYKFINSIETHKNHKRALKVYICELKDLRMKL